MNYLNYLFFRFSVFLFGILPFFILYKISDLLAWVLRKVLRYRIQTVNENLERVYPALNPQKKARLVRDIYRNLADISVESIKGMSMSPQVLKKRHYCANPELLDQAFEQNKSVILTTGHYNNWEWGAFSPNYFLKHQIIGFYKPLTNPYINNYVIKKRGTSGTILADINETQVYYDKYHDQRAVFLVAGDQSPTKPHKAIWMEFLGQKTACLHGIEKYLEKYPDLAVIFCEIKRVKRGTYELELSWIKDINSPSKAYGEVTKTYMKRLEAVIEKSPANWLWTHRRWKHTPN